MTKESRCEAGAAVKNFKLFDQLSEEIAELKQQPATTKRAELWELKKREKKSQWYLKKKRLSATDDSDFMESTDDNESSSTTSKRSRSDTPRSPPFHVPQPLSPLSPHSTHSPSPYPCSVETGTSRSTSIEIPSDNEPPTANSPPEQHF